MFMPSQNRQPYAFDRWLRLDPKIKVVHPVGDAYQAFNTDPGLGAQMHQFEQFGHRQYATFNPAAFVVQAAQLRISGQQATIQVAKRLDWNGEKRRAGRHQFSNPP